MVPNAYTVTIAALVNPSANGFVLSLSKPAATIIARSFRFGKRISGFICATGRYYAWIQQTGQSRVNKWAVVILSMDQPYDGGPVLVSLGFGSTAYWFGPEIGRGAVALTARVLVPRFLYVRRFAARPAVTAKIISQEFLWYFSDVDAKSLTDKYWQIFAP